MVLDSPVDSLGVDIQAKQKVDLLLEELVLSRADSRQAEIIDECERGLALVGLLQHRSKSDSCTPTILESPVDLQTPVVHPAGWDREALGRYCRRRVEAMAA